MQNGSYIPKPGDTVIVRSDQPNGLKKGDVGQVGVVRGRGKHVDLHTLDTPPSQPYLISETAIAPIEDA